MRFSFCVLFTLGLLFTSHSFEFSKWLNKVRALKNRLKEMYKQKSLVPHGSVSVGPKPSGPLDFPANNEKKKKIIHELWTDYYDCLESKKNIIKDNKVSVPYTMSAFIGSSTTLDCNLCVSPEDILQNSEWYYTPQPSIINPDLIDEDEHKQISAYTFTLHFYNLQKHHSGLYYCQLSNVNDAPYFLHVLDLADEPVLEVHSNLGREGPFPQNATQIPDTNIVIWNEYTDWTDCSWCGRVGTRRRIGYCKISLISNIPNDILKTLGKLENETAIPDDVRKETEKLLAIFVFGVPCRSKLLPKAFLENSILQLFYTEIMTGYCKVPCPTDIRVEIIDESGNVVDVADNSAGQYSLYQEVPSTPPVAERVVVYASLNRGIVLPCPGSLYIDVPVEWTVAGKILNKEALEMASGNRVTLNDLNQLVFKSFDEVDAKVYSCWENKELAGVVSLKIRPPASGLEEYKAVLSLYPICMFIAIFGLMIYLTFYICLNHKKAKIGAQVSKKRKGRFVIQFLADVKNEKRKRRLKK